MQKETHVAGLPGEGIHVLIVPSEEYLPPASHMEGIFQHHQALALRQAGCKVGVIAVSLAHSVPMIAKAAFMRAVGRRVPNDLREKTIPELARLLWAKSIQDARFLSTEERPEAFVVRAEGFYFLPPMSPVREWAWVRAGVQAFEKYCRMAGAPDMLHAHNTELAGLLAHRIHQMTGIPYIITEHSTHYQRGLVPAARHPSLRRAIRKASRFVVVSPGLGERVVDVLGDCASKFLWIPNVLEDHLFSTPIREGGCQGTADRDPIFLALGNLIPSKNHGLLLQAFHDYLATGARGSLRIGGKGPLAAQLHSQAERLGIVQNVAFLGECTRPRVLQELDACDALVLPSRHETFGVVAIEALARGRRVIATRSGGPEYFVTPQDGVLVDNDDRAGLAAALLRFGNNRKDYSPVEIRQRALERFGSTAIATALVAEYRSALATR